SDHSTGDRLSPFGGGVDPPHRAGSDSGATDGVSTCHGSSLLGSGVETRAKLCGTVVWERVAGGAGRIRTQRGEGGRVKGGSYRPVVDDVDPAWNLIHRPKPTMQANQMMPTTSVYRSRFFSATDEPARLLETPPPNMLDRPPPLPRWSRISSVSSTLVMISNTTRVYANAIMVVGPPGR